MDGQKNDKGTSPSGKKPEELTIPELKAWLLSRGAPVKGKKGDLVKRYGHLEVVKLLVQQGAKIESTESNGRTPLHQAVWWGRLEIVKVLVQLGAKIESADNNGETPLHLAARRGRVDVVAYLLQRGCDPNPANTEGKTPLSLTNNSEIIKLLLHHDADPKGEYVNLLKEAGDSDATPPESLVKLFVVGDTGAGKSTLTRSLEEKCSSKGVTLLKRIKKVSGVQPKTAGVDPHKIESKEFGSVQVYDFAGHKEFYASHDSLLSNTVVGSSSAVFLVVADLSKSDGEFEEKIQYWVRFLEGKCSKASTQPHVVIVGSHADRVKSSELSKKAEITTRIRSSMSSLHFAGFVAINCQYAVSDPMSKLCSILASSCGELRVKSRIEGYSHSLLVYIVSHFPNALAVPLQSVLGAIQSEGKDKAGSTLAFYLAREVDKQLMQACHDLNERGNILLLSNAAIPNESWIVLDQTTLLSQVTGTVFAPVGFDQHRQLATNTGIVPFSKVASAFPKLDPIMITLFLTQLEFCREVNDREILQCLGTTMESQSRNERFFFFPGLVSIDAPTTIWPQKDGLSYHSGWVVQCTQPQQFLTPRFLEVTLLRFALSDDLTPPHEEHCSDHPAIQRKAEIWKNGIYWSTQTGVEALLEVTDRMATLSIRCCENEELFCVELRSAIIAKVREVLRELCPTVKTSEHILPPSVAKQQEGTPVPVDQHAVPISEIARAVSNAHKYVRYGDNPDIDTLLYFEPYAHLSRPLLVDILDQSEPHQSETVSDSFFERFSVLYERSSNAERSSRNLIEALTLSVDVLRERIRPADSLFRALQLWRDATEGTYRCLRTTLDGVSIFAGRSPLDMAGIELLDRQTISLDRDLLPEDTQGVLQQKPEMHQLMYVQVAGVNTKVRVITEIQAKWEKLAHCLKFNAGLIAGVERDNRGDCEAACTEILQRWLDGDLDARQPVTWETLIQTLRETDASFESLAHKLKYALLHQ